MIERDEPIFYPDNPAPHLTDWFLDIGPATATGMGEVPLGWLEIDAWCERTGIDLDPWEARTIRSLSRAYVGQRHDARKRDCPPPYDPQAENEALQQAKVDEQFKAMLTAFTRKPKHRKAVG